MPMSVHGKRTVNQNNPKVPDFHMGESDLFLLALRHARYSMLISIFDLAEGAN